MVGWVGLEPTTNGLKGRCSTTELPTHEARTNGQLPSRAGKLGSLERPRKGFSCVFFGPCALHEPPRWLRRLAAETMLLETEQTEPGRLCHLPAHSRYMVTIRGNSFANTTLQMLAEWEF